VGILFENFKINRPVQARGLNKWIFYGSEFFYSML
jgi:hypothetical protein